MRKTQHYEATRTAIKRDPRLLDSLDSIQLKVAKAYYLEQLSLEEIAKGFLITMSVLRKTMDQIKRKISMRAMTLLCEAVYKTQEVDPRTIWGNDFNMQSFMRRWIDVACLFERLLANPSEGLRNQCVRALFEYMKHTRDVMQILCEHQYIKG